jgi:tetratricopeptide (TPR) repeat protein
MESLHLYELVLLIAGAVLFLALVFGLVYSLVKNKPLKNIYWFFIFPIIMIGFPSIQSFSFENGKVEIKKLTSEVKNNPENEEKRKELEEAITKVDPERIEKDSEASKYIAQAQFELGNIEESEKAIHDALAIKKDDPEAIQLNNKIIKTKQKKIIYQQNIKKLENLIHKSEEKNTASSQDIKNITEILSKTEPPKFTDEKSQLIIAKSLVTIGDKENSTKVAETILENNPNSKEAIAIKNETVIKKNLTNFKINNQKFEKAIILKE